MARFGILWTGNWPVAWRLCKYVRLRSTSLVQWRLGLKVRDLEMRETVSDTDVEATVVESFA